MKTYLEYKDEKSQKFWEIEVLGDGHTVRYGVIGSNGRVTTKTFESEEKAQKDAEKLITSKKKKDYEEVTADTRKEKAKEEVLLKKIECKLLTEEEKGKIKSLKFENGLDSHWDYYFKQFLGGTIRPTITRNGWYERNFIYQFDELSTWKIENYTTDIIRNSDGNIKSISYSIEGLTVLTLNDYENYSETEKNQLKANYIHGPIETFWGYTYEFGAINWIVEGMEELLQQLPQFLLDNIEQALKKGKKNQKEEKIARIAENNVEVLIKNLFKDTEYSYSLEEDKKSVLLTVKVCKENSVELSLPHKTFLKRIDKIIPTIELVNKNLNIDGIENKNLIDGENFILDKKPTKLEFSLFSYLGPKFEFGDFREGKFSVIHDDFKAEFLSKKFKQYADKTVFSGKRKPNNYFLKELSEMNIDGFGLEMGIKKDNNNQYEGIKLQYSINGKRVLIIDNIWLDADFIWKEYISFKNKGGIPAQKEFRSLLEGFVEFYNEINGKEGYEEAVKEKTEKLQPMIDAFNELPNKLKEVIEKKGNKYVINNGGRHGLNGGYNFFFTDVYVNMNAVRGRVLRTRLHYKDYPQNFEKFSNIVDVFEQTLKEAPLPFKFL